MSAAFASLPAALRAACLRVAARHDVHSADAMHGQCEVVSTELREEVLETIATMPLEDDDDRAYYTCHLVQMFDAPAELASNDMAQGHYTLFVAWDMDEFYVDMTAAQFPALGQTGPVVRRSHRW